MFIKLNLLLIQQIACIKCVSIDNSNMKIKFTFLVVAMLAIVQSTGYAQHRGHHRSVPHRPNAQHSHNNHHSHNKHHSNNGTRNALAVVGAGLIVNSIIQNNRSAYYRDSSEYAYTRPNVNYTTVAAREYYWDEFASCWRIRVVYRRVSCYP